MILKNVLSRETGDVTLPEQIPSLSKGTIEGCALGRSIFDLNALRPKNKIPALTEIEGAKYDDPTEVVYLKGISKASSDPYGTQYNLERLEVVALVAPIEAFAERGKELVIFANKLPYTNAEGVVELREDKEASKKFFGYCMYTGALSRWQVLEFSPEYADALEDGELIKEIEAIRGRDDQPPEKDVIVEGAVTEEDGHEALHTLRLVREIASYRGR